MTDLSPDVQALLNESYESDLTEEESEELLLLCGHGIGPKLSPAAFAVWDAAWDCPVGDCSIKQGRRRQIAAALRAVADQSENLYDPHEGKVSVVRVEKLLDIAAELEGADD